MVKKKKKVIVWAGKVYVHIRQSSEINTKKKKKNLKKGQIQTSSFHSEKTQRILFIQKETKPKFLYLKKKIKKIFSLKGKNVQRVHYPGRDWRQKQQLAGSATGKSVWKQQAGLLFRANGQSGKGAGESGGGFTD